MYGPLDAEQTLQTRLVVKGSAETALPLCQRRGDWWLAGRSAKDVHMKQSTCESWRNDILGIFNLLCCYCTI